MELFSPCTLGSNGGVITAVGDMPAVRLNGANHRAHMAFKIPWDFASIHSAFILVNPLATQAAADWDLEATFASPGQAYNTHIVGSGAVTYNVVNTIIFKVDVSGVLALIVAGDEGGIRLEQIGAAHSLDVLGLQVRYL